MSARPQTASPARVTQRELIDIARQCHSLALRNLRIRDSGDGDMPSALIGRGMEFEEVRSYQQGDEPRHIDWRVTARTGKPHTKVFREERERPVLIALDLRSSMHFATQAAYKSVLAARLAAAVAWVASANGDRVGGFVFSENFHAELKPRQGNKAVLRLIHTIADAPVWEQTQSDSVSAPTALLKTLRGLQRVARKGALVVLFTDARHWDELSLQALSQLRKGNDLLIFHHCDPLEIALPRPAQYFIKTPKSSFAANFAGSSARRQHASAFEARAACLSDLANAHTRYQRVVNGDSEPELLRALFGGGQS